MPRPVVLLLALLVFAPPSIGSAKTIKSLATLTPTQAQELRESEDRLVLDDRALQSLERDRKNHKIGAQDYAWQSHDLAAYIRAEADFQNDLLTQGPNSHDIELPEGVNKVLRTVGKYSVEVPWYILQAAASGLANSHFTFSP